MALSAQHITVSFPGVKALQDVSVELQPARVHALLGANGSGKSTLVKVLTGVYHPDADCGSVIAVGEREVSDISNPTQAQQLGIRVVHQETPMINSFTVAECVAMSKGYPRKRSGLIDWRASRRYVRELLDTFGLGLDPDTPAGELSAAERNMLAMCIAIGKDEEMEQAVALLLDEADASIPEAEAEIFLEHVRRIAALGIPVGMVTHRLKAVRRYCDDVTILNGGKAVYKGVMAETEDDFIIARMSPHFNAQTGEIAAIEGEKRELKKLWALLDKTAPAASEEPVLEFESVQARNLNGLSFQLRPGEILGFIGVPDSGVNQLPLVLGCDEHHDAGRYTIRGQMVPPKAEPRTAFRLGLSLLPSDRPKRGGIMPLSLTDNISLPNEMQFWHRGKLKLAMMDECVELLDVHPHDQYSMEFGKFSGGNQQKALMAKWLATCPAVFVLDDPTYGVDPASRIKLFETIQAAADENVGIILFSTEPEQLAGICTRILVLSGGQVERELRRDDGSLTREEIARWCYA